ncbi:MAG TPA: hypothetical protein VH255_10880 [Verrucomicrobiae bacterium]|nr:hypothetical protein [Verrucomicrobiae bacterium]
MKIQKLSLAVLAAAGLLAFSVPAHADDTNSTPKMTPPTAPAGRPARGFTAEAQMDRLTTALTLTDDEKPKVKAIVDDQFKQMSDLRSDTSMSPDDRRTKMQAIRTDVTAKMKDVLTADQFAKYQALPMGGRAGGARRPAADGSSTNAPAKQ